MKYIHVFPMEKFTMPYIEFINRNFNSNEHLFIVYFKKSKYYNPIIENVKNVIIVNNNIQLLVAIIKRSVRSNKVLFHSLGISNKIIIFLALFKSIIKKSSWIIWGADLYTYIAPEKKFSIINKMRGALIKNLNEICYLVKNDYSLAKNNYKTEAKGKWAVYVSPTNVKLLDEFSDAKKINDGYINIQIGNSATRSNNHKEVIDMLEKFKDEKIRVFIPLSYGDDNYAKEIEAYAKKHLGEKAIPIMKYMGTDEYAKFLNSIDIAIFNNNRQQALGNIFALSYLQSKIYMKTETTMWEDLTLEQGYEFYNVDRIKDMSYEEFISMDKTKKDKNKELSLFRFSEEKIFEVWMNIFSND